MNEKIPQLTGIIQADNAVVPTGLLSVHTAITSYVNALFLSTFFAALFIYFDYSYFGFGLLIFCVIGLPICAYTDRVVFDGKRLRRRGIIPQLWAGLNNLRTSLKVNDIEQIETHNQRIVKRGGKVFFRYRTIIKGKGVVFNIGSSGRQYRQMIKAIFPMVSEDILDNRSIELRDYIAEPREVSKRASISNIPSADVLESARTDFERKSKSPRLAVIEAGDAALDEKVGVLRQLANELRMSGSLLQAIETFRRAVMLRPQDAWLLFEFARCLYSFAGTQNDRKMERKATAMMRLAEKRGQNDGDLLVRIGESYYQSGDWRRAEIVFEKAVEIVGESYRLARGQAEVALRDGKLAHVIHRFSAANRLAQSNSLKRWTKGEVEYFSRLNSDEEYMELEISRMNLVDSLMISRRTALQVAFFALPIIIAGIYLSENRVAEVGWAIGAFALLLWVGLHLGVKLLGSRIPIELMDED